MKKVLLVSMVVVVILTIVCWRLFPRRDYQHGYLSPDPNSTSATIAPTVVTPAEKRRPRDRFAVIPGGITCDDLATIVAIYPTFESTKCKMIKLAADADVYVAYRRNGKMYWTQKKVHLATGEEVVTDGTLFIRARCGNNFSSTAKKPTEINSPTGAELETPDTEPIPTPAETSSLTPPSLLTPEFSEPSPPVETEQPPSVEGGQGPPIEYPYPPIAITGGGGGFPPPVEPPPPPATTPEPNTFLLLGSGLCIATFFLRRSRRSNR